MKAMGFQTRSGLAHMRKQPNEYLNILISVTYKGFRHAITLSCGGVSEKRL